MQPEKYMWASVQTIRGCPKHCSFAAFGGPMGQQPGNGNIRGLIDEIVALRRIGFRFIALADDNFYPVSLTDLRLAKAQSNLAKLNELTAIRAERFQLMEELAKLPKDMVFYTQITMEAAEDGEFLDAMRKANIKGALVGVEAVTPEGSKPSSKTGTAPATHWSSSCNPSKSTAFMCSAPSSSDCRPTIRRPSTRRSRWR